MNRNNGIKVIEAMLGLMDLVVLMLSFCSLHRVGPRVDRTLRVLSEGHDGSAEMAVCKKNQSSARAEDHQSVWEID